ncbi:MAG: GSU2403 family nucleotidyltransferase fold protein [Beijerinckiaceae bacterium]
MRKIPSVIQTLYSELHQRLHWRETDTGSPYVLRQGDAKFVYVKRTIGARTWAEYIGSEGASDTVAKVTAIKAANDDRKERRHIVRALKTAGLPGPTIAMGRILEAIAAGGLFDPPKGLVLVGTTAFAAYAPLIGFVPDAHAIMTQDIDLAVIELAIAADRPNASIHSAFERAGINMAPEGAFDPPARLVGGGLTVEFLTKLRRGGEGTVRARGLGVSAQALPYMDYLITDPIPVAILYLAGVLVRVPQPARYAVHKLIIANFRKRDDPAKRLKDLQQAAQLIRGLHDSGQGADVNDALADAKGKARKLIDASLKAIDDMTPGAIALPR